MIDQQYICSTEANNASRVPVFGVVKSTENKYSVMSWGVTLHVVSDVNVIVALNNQRDKKRISYVR